MGQWKAKDRRLGSGKLDGCQHVLQGGPSLGICSADSLRRSMSMNNGA